MAKQEVIDIVNAALERRRIEAGGDWQDLAKKLEVDPDTIWRWRKGRLGKAMGILIEVIATSSLRNPPHSG